MAIMSYDTLGPGSASTLTPPISNYVNVYAMDGSTARTVTWPASGRYCSISAPSGPFWVRADGPAAVIPVADVLDGTGSALNVSQRQRAHASGPSFSIISSTVQLITIEFWSTYPTA